MFVVNQSDGSCPVCTDRLKIWLNAGEMVSAHYFSILLGMLSGPHALAGLRFQRCFATPFVLMTKLVSPGYGADSILGS